MESTAMGSSAEANPNILAVVSLASTTRPVCPLMTSMAVCVFVEQAPVTASLSLKACSARRRSLTSRPTPWKPISVPLASRRPLTLVLQPDRGTVLAVVFQLDPHGALRIGLAPRSSANCLRSVS